VNVFSTSQTHLEEHGSRPHTLLGFS